MLMKAIVVYYSMDGNTKYVADKISQIIGADTLRLEPTKEYPKGNVSKFFWGGKSVVFGEKPKLQPYQFNAKDYDLIIIGTPIWASSLVPPIKTFLNENDLSNKKVAFYSCSMGGDANKCFTKMKSEISNPEVISTLSLVEPYVKPSKENEAKIEAFCKQCI